MQSADQISENPPNPRHPRSILVFIGSQPPFAV
jgi:hypothetical protein